MNVFLVLDDSLCIVNTQPPGHDILKVGWYTIVDKT